MRKTLQKMTSALLVLLMIFSLMSTAAAGAELASGSDDPPGALIGAAAPVITLLEPGEGGMLMKWEALSGVSLYRVYRWYDDIGWMKLTDTDALSYADTSAVPGNTYQYRLVGVDVSGNVITASTTRLVDYIVPERVTNAENIADGIRVYWDKPEGAGKVAVYRMTSSGWKRIATTADSSYLDKDVSYNSEYRYTVRALTDSGAFLNQSYDDTGLTIRRAATPVLRVENVYGGVNISWGSVEGAEGYRVFYRNSKGGWTRLGDTTSTSLFDDDVRSNRNYNYTVRCVSADGKYYTSYFDTSGKSIKYIASPVLISAEGTGEGIRISWKASEGAAKYRIFYRNSKGNWARMVDTTATTYHDKDVAPGRTFTYTVRCMNSSGDYISYFDKEGVTGTFLSSPVVTLSNADDGVNIRWDAVKGAVNYRVYYYGRKGWTKLTDTKETSFLDTDVSSNHTYTYTVRCINEAGTDFTSGYLAGKSIKYYAAPKITRLTNTEDGVKITWGAVSGAQKYRVYYYGRNGWTKMSDTASTSYVDKVVASGTTYTYTVRCVNSAGTAFMSYYRPGVKHQYIAAPDFSVSLKDDGNILVSWNAVKGAELYRVYERTGTGSWKRLTDTADTSYIYQNTAPDSTRVFTVRCLNADATEFTSDYHAGKGIGMLATPRISSLSNTTEGVGIKWDTVKGAVKYRVYYKGKTGWKKLTDTTATSVVDTDVSSNHRYTYTVRCINTAGTVFESSYDSTGTSILYIASPKNLKADSEKNSVKISWTPSAGAAKYRVYYKGRNGWTKLAETTSSSVIDTDISSGSTYTYTVRCISADGKSFTSDYDHNGVAYKYTEVPVLKAPELAKDGILIKWNESKKAEKYRVYYYGSKGWTKMAETTSTSYLDTDISSGHNYRYTVRCITSDGKKFTSDCDTAGVKIYYCSTPKLVSMDAGKDSVTFSWTKPSGASRYRVYKKVSGSWKRIAETTSNSYTDTDVSSGSAYTYTVRVVSADSSKFYSYYDTEGFTAVTDSGTVSPGVNGFYYYDQGDYIYPYGDDTIAYSGCGPVCFAMVASTLKNKSITPIDAVAWCGNSYYVENVGTRWDYFDAAAQHFGIHMEKHTDSVDEVAAALRSGKYAISAQSRGIFTSSGHFIALAGVTSDGKLIVYDPNGGNNYIGTAFTKQEVNQSSSGYWIFDK